MVTKKSVIEKILGEIGTEKLSLGDAIERAEAIKPLKNKDKLKNWEGHFKKIGVVTKDETGTFVSSKIVSAPVSEPIVETPKTE